MDIDAVVPAEEALNRLLEGNRRFAAGEPADQSLACRDRRAQLVAGQRPFAVILGCSDSRVPAEIVFGQGLGDLFVIRVAGNLVARSQIGSVEFAVENFGTRLVVIMGHSHCGAIDASIQHLSQPGGELSEGLRFVVDQIKPAVEPLMGDAELRADSDALMHAAVRANVSATASQLRAGSDIVKRHIEQGGLQIIGAEYDLDSGLVDFFDR